MVLSLSNATSEKSEEFVTTRDFQPLHEAVAQKEGSRHLWIDQGQAQSVRPNLNALSDLVQD